MCVNDLRRDSYACAFKTRTSGLYFRAFRPNVALSFGDHIEMRNFKTRTRVGVFKNRLAYAGGHFGAVMAIAFVPDDLT